MSGECTKKTYKTRVETAESPRNTRGIINAESGKRVWHGGEKELLFRFDRIHHNRKISENII
jgi:hypothetical protein